MPYKRYSSEAIEKGVCNAQKELPCEFTTIRNWKIWFYLLGEYFEATLRSNKINVYKSCKAPKRNPVTPTT